MFDDLYGQGSWETFTELIPSPEGTTMAISQVDIRDGVRVYVYWFRDEERIGYLKADHFRDRVVWVAHHAPMRGHLRALIRNLGPWYLEHGLWDMVMSSREPGKLTSQHEAVGFRLDETGSRAHLDLRTL